MQRELVTVPLAIEKLNADLGKASDDAAKAPIQQQLREAQAYLTELKQIKVILPNVTFDRHLTIIAITIRFEVLFVGKGHSMVMCLFMTQRESHRDRGRTDGLGAYNGRRLYL